MGEVTFASVLDEHGREEVFGGVEEARKTGAEGRIELGYAYAPGLLPAQARPTDGMWRYRNLLPVGEGGIRYPLVVGGTPLVAPTGLREVAGMPRLYLKDETRTPTGSNKDRATALVLERAMRDGVSDVSCASTGNVAVSLAVGAAAAGLRARIFVPSEVYETKLRLMLLSGATVLKVDEGYEAAFDLSRRAAETFGWYDRNTGINPLTLEAKKTVAFEIWEQLGRRVPDAVLVPVGDGPTLSAMAKGFRELVACGVAGRMPRIVGVQAEGCQPLKRAWETGEPVRSVSPETIADGIAIGAPVSAGLVLRDVRVCGGGFVTVSDGSMLEAVRTLAAKGGIIAEPAGSAAFAAIGAALEAGLIERDELVVAHVTGTGLKSPHYLLPETAPLEICATLEEVERAIGPA